LTGYETLVEGHGVFKVEGDTFYTPTNPDLDPWRAFDDNISGNNRWRQGNSQFTAGGGPIDNRRYAEGLPNASWLVLHLPYDINLNGYSICPQGGQSPENIQIWGSNDGGTSWSHLHTQTQTEGDNTTYQNYTISHEGYYSIIAYLILTLTPSTATEASIRDMKYFGTPGPTTLDKGSLSLTRSLDVPRVSRYDVDTETPRPEKLVVDFDTTVNSSPTDISGQGNHGTLYGDAQYSAADKAFKFDGTDDYIETSIDIGSGGNMLICFSTWVKYNADGWWFWLGDESTPGGIGVESRSSGTRIRFVVRSGNYVEINGPGYNTWNHYTFIHTGSTTSDGRMDIYMNGVFIEPVDTRFNYATTNITNNNLRIGDRGASQNIDGQISNFKLYNAILEPSEVRKLYRLGRTGRSMVISDTAVGIGKVPEAQLDVRGMVNVDGNLQINGFNTKRVLIGYQRFSDTTAVVYANSITDEQYQDAWSVNYIRKRSGSQIYIISDLAVAQAIGATSGTNYRDIDARLKVWDGSTEVYSDVSRDWTRVDSSFFEYHRNTRIHFGPEPIPGAGTGDYITVVAQIAQSAGSGTHGAWGINIWGGRSFIEVFETMEA